MQMIKVNNVKFYTFIDKVSSLNSVYISKDFNRKIFINIDKINNAIKDKKQISFNYYDYNFEKDLVPRLNKEGDLKVYRATPVSMILKNENYYLVLASNKHNDLSNYRVDRMKNINILDEDARWTLQLGKYTVVIWSRNLKEEVKKELIEMVNLY
mgnify:CR=1 FL=1